jgi:osmotically-inducible protein OsmY
MTMRVASLLLPLVLSGSLHGCFPVVAVGVGAGTLAAQDQRTKDSYVDDRGIEFNASERIYSQIKSVMHVNVTSFNRNVLISGEVPDETTKAEISAIVSGIEKVHNVSNELAVSPNSSIISRSNDSLVASNVKLRFMNDNLFKSEHIKVVTENGTVYLLGIVNHAEADAATEVASTTKGVQSVVKLFEYLD